MVTKLDPVKRLALVDKLLPALREEHEKIGALIEELEAVTGGAATIGEKIKELETHFATTWEWRYKEPYAWTDFARTRSQWKTLLRKLPMPVLVSRVTNYIHNNEPFYVDRKHPFGLFVSTINQHATAREHELSDTPTGCRHDPPCRDQFEHTKRRQVEATT